MVWNAVFSIVQNSALASPHLDKQADSTFQSYGVSLFKKLSKSKLIGQAPRNAWTDRRFIRGCRFSEGRLQVVKPHTFSAVTPQRGS